MSKDEENPYVYSVSKDFIDDQIISRLEDDIQKLVCIFMFWLHLMTDHVQTGVKVKLDESETPVTIWERVPSSIPAILVRRNGGEGSVYMLGENLRELRKRSTAQPSRLSKPPKANGRERKQLTKMSILSPVNPTKVSRAPGKSRISHQKISIPRDILPAAEKTTTNFNIPKHRRKQASKVKDSVPSSLHPIHSSRVSKPGKTRPAGLCIDDTKLSSTIGLHRLKGKDNLGMSLAAATNKKTLKPSAKSLPRRSTRRSKKA